MSRLTKLFLSRIVFGLLTVAIVALFIQLSIWQWHRYQFKKNLEQTFTEALHAVAPQDIHATLKHLDAKAAQIGYIKISAMGHYEQKQFLLDNRTNNNQVGFDVITPFTLSTGQTILINRGFIPSDVHRHIQNDITPPRMPLQLTGLLTKPSKGFILGPVIENTANWPERVMRIDPPLLSQSLQRPLLNYVVLLDQNASDGFVRNWSPPNLWSQRSLGYCFQWLALALTVVIIYFVMLFKSKEKKNVSK